MIRWDDDTGFFDREKSTWKDEDILCTKDDTIQKVIRVFVNVYNVAIFDWFYTYEHGQTSAYVNRKKKTYQR